MGALTIPPMRSALYGSLVPAAKPKKHAESKGKTRLPRTLVELHIYLAGDSGCAHRHAETDRFGQKPQGEEDECSEDEAR